MAIKMINLSLVVLVVLMSVQFGNTQRDVSRYPHTCQFFQDLTEGAPPSMDVQGVSIQEYRATGWDHFSWFYKYFCISQAMFRVSPPPGTTAILITFNMFNPQMYSFHIGDTSTNDGEGGDRGTGGGFDAEMYGFNHTLHVYKQTPVGRTKVPHTFIEYFLNYPQVFLTVRITPDGFKFLSKGRSRQYKLEMENEDMFRFDDLYIGTNRMIGDDSKVGIGICGLCIAFEDASSTNVLN